MESGHKTVSSLKQKQTWVQVIHQLRNKRIQNVSVCVLKIQYKKGRKAEKSWLEEIEGEVQKIWILHEKLTKTVKNNKGGKFPGCPS